MSKIQVKPFQDLYDAAKESSEEARGSPSLASRVSRKAQEALQETFGDATKAAKVVAQKAKLGFTFFENEVDLKIDNQTPMYAVTNWLVVAFKDVIEKINDHGEVIAAIMKKLSDVLDSETSKEELKQKHDDLVKKCEDLEKRLDERGDRDEDDTTDDLKQKQADLEQKTKDMEKTFDKKCDALEKNYDEVRQRGLKGNLIISSPERSTRGGHPIPSLAKHRMFRDRHGMWRSETDLEMVQRMVESKTGVWVHERDITACHPLGRRERNSFILCINNRSPMSSWDIITRGMMSADNNFSYDNVFINFQLTKRRGDICKELRKAKKENIVKNYEIDANGRIFVKYGGLDNKAYEIIDLEDIQKYFPGVK